MQGILFVAVVVAVFGSGLAQTRPPPDPCRTCQIIINIARHHFNNSITDKNALQQQLLMECQRLGQMEGQAAGQQCTNVVNNNIDTIYNDMSTNKSALQTCQDIKECPMLVQKRQKRQQHDPCRVCEIIIGIAKRHFHNNITDQNALKTQLDMECQNLVNHGFSQDEATHCQQVVDANIAAIFTELKNNPNASPRKICQDFKECPQPTGQTPMRQKRQRPDDNCRTCEIIVSVARHHFNNSITDKNALKAQLLMECQRVGQMEGQTAGNHCISIVNANIDKIFMDMSTNKTSRQTCQDIKECPQPTGQTPMRQKRQRPHDPCRTCEIIVSVARHHFNNSITDKNALKAQLLMECQRVGQMEGQVAGNHCISIVNNNIDKIYADMSTNKTSRQTCQDIKECPQPTGQAPMREKRQRPHDPCRTCEIIVNIARHHFHNNVTDKNALLQQLLSECQHLGQIEGQQASADCTRIVNNNIDQIYADMSTNKPARQTCQDIKECPQKSVVQREKRQRPHDPCRTCEIIVNIARFHFHNNITDKNALQQQLLAECRRLGATEGQQAADHCVQIVNNNIDTIFADMSTNKPARQTCQDINECPKPTGQAPRRQKRQRPNDACRTCEIIINIARFHFHNNINDKNALKAQLLMECQRLAQTEGQAASQHCTQIVNNNIDQIYNDMSTNKSPRQTCQDIKECPQ